MENNNFKWLINDMYENFVIKLFYRKDGKEVDCGTFDVGGIYNTPGDELNIEFANIKDIEEFLTLGIVRFRNINDSGDVIDIPFRNIYKLYKNSFILGESTTEERWNNLDELEAFSILDGTIINKNYFVASYIIDLDKISDSDLKKLMKIANMFNNDLGIHERFAALNDANLINYQRIKKDNSQMKR